jgi:hypothetical protein
MSTAMLYLPPPDSDEQRLALSGWRRLIAMASHPVMILILLLCCVWMALWPKKRVQLQRLRARVPSQHSLLLCIHVLAGVVLARWPLFVVTILATGAGVGLILAGFQGAWWGLGASVIGASLAPVIADEVPPRLFKGHRGR